MQKEKEENKDNLLGVYKTQGRVEKVSKTGGKYTTSLEAGGSEQYTGRTTQQTINQ